MQIHAVDEVIVVDDCSTDGTRAIVSKYPVELLTTNVNSGHAAARNIGIQAATGDVIAWIDADDYWEPNHLEVVCGLLEEHREAAVAFSGVRCFGTRERIWTGFPCSGGPTNVFRDCLEKTIVPAMSAVTRTQALREVGGFDASIRVAPDFDLWLRMARRYQFVSSDAVTANRRYHGAQISAQSIRQWISMHESRFRMAQALRHCEPEPYDLAHEVVTERALARLETDLESLWDSRQLEDFKRLARFAEKFPIRGRARAILGRQAIPQVVVRLWDRVKGTF